jgi:hypothetical protein
MKSNNTSKFLLIAANTLPLIGVLAFEWSVRDILLLYWAESGVIGIYTILRILRTHKTETPIPPVQIEFYKLTIIIFFIIHFGLFMSVHRIFIYAFSMPKDIALASTNQHRLMIATSTLALLISHGISYQQNFLKKKEYENVSIERLMAQPYIRIAAMQFTLIFGAFLFGLFKHTAAALAILVIAKIIIDLFAHNQEREKFKKSHSVTNRQLS